MNMIYKVIWNSATNTWVAVSELAMSGGRKRTLHKSALAAALVLSAPFGAAWASETCDLANGQKGMLDENGLCVAEAPVFGPKFGAGGGDDNGEVSNVAVGVGATAGNQSATAVGSLTSAETLSSTAIGSSAHAFGGTGAAAFGRLASANGQGAVALGSGSGAVGTGSTAIGFNAAAAVAGATAIGNGANATLAGSIALGNNSVADRANALSLGSATLKRQIINVAAGTADNDATNFAQLKSTSGSIATAIGGGSVVNPDGTISAPSYSVGGTSVNSIGGAITNIDGRVTSIEGDLDNGTIGLVKQDATTNGITVAGDKAGATVDFTGTEGARTLSGVAAGDLSAASSDAVNGSQLFETNANVANNTTAITNLGDQVTDMDGRVTSIEGDLDSGTIGLVRQDATTGGITVASASGGTSVDFTGTAGARVLSGVANGTDDQDAATIAQLKSSGLVDPNDGRALNALVYDDVSLNRATLGGTNGTVIANMANGLIAVGSREGVNGGQLATIRDDLQSQIGNVSNRVDVIEGGIADGSIGGGGPVDDNGGSTISNVGDGVADSDAANVGQVNQRFEQAVTESKTYTDTRFDQLQGDFNQRFEAMDGRIDRMAALSGAYAGMAMNTAGLAGKNRIGAGVGAQGGKAALAVGYQRIVGQRNNASVSIGGAFSGSEKSISAGAGFSW